MAELCYNETRSISYARVASRRTRSGSSRHARLSASAVTCPANGLALASRAKCVRVASLPRVETDAAAGANRVRKLEPEGRLVCLAKVEEGEQKEEDGADDCDCGRSIAWGQLTRGMEGSTKMDDDALYLTEILVDSQRPPMTAPAVQRPWPMMVPKAMM